MKCLNNMKAKYLIPALLLLLITGKTTAQDSVSYNLDYFIELAIESNHNIKIKRNDATIAKNNATLSNAGLLADFSLSGNYTLSSQNTKQEFSVQGFPPSDEKGAKTKMYGGSIDVSRTIFNGFYGLNNYKKLKEQSILSDITLKIEIENTIVSVSSAYYNLVSIDNDLQIANENFNVSKERLKKVKRSLNFGQVNDSERLNAISALNTDSLQVLNLENNKRKAFSDLIKNVGTDSIFFTADFALSTELLLPGYEQLRNELTKNNTNLKSNHLNLNISQLEYKMAKASNYPRLSVNGSYAYDRQDYDVGMMVLNETLGPSVTLSLSYNLFDFGKKQKDIQNAKISHENKKLNLDMAELQIEQDFEKAWVDYQFQINSVEIEQSNVKIEEDRFARTKNSYYLGQSDNLTFRDAQLSLARAKSNLVKAHINSKLAEMELLRLAGILVK